MTPAQRDISRKLRIFNYAKQIGNVTAACRHFGISREIYYRWHVLDLGMDHVYIKPRTPRLNGKVERSHSTDQQEFYQLLSYKDDVDLEAKLMGWETFYNCHRPHASLKGKTPYEILLDKLQSNPTSTESISSTKAAMLTSLLRVNLLQNLQGPGAFFGLGSSEITEVENSEPNRCHTSGK